MASQLTLVLIFKLRDHLLFLKFQYCIPLSHFQQSSSINSSPNRPFTNKKDGLKNVQQHTPVGYREFHLFYLAYLYKDTRTLRVKTRKLGAHLMHCMLLPSSPSFKIKSFRSLKSSGFSEELEIPNSTEGLNSFYNCEMPLAYRVTLCSRLRSCFNKVMLFEVECCPLT